MVRATRAWSHRCLAQAALNVTCASPFSKPVTSPWLSGSFAHGRYAVRPVMPRFRIRCSFRVAVLYVLSLLAALAGSLQVNACMAAARSIDPHIYSSAAWEFKADRGIFSAVPKQQVDARIFSPISSEPNQQVHDPARDYVRPRHNL
jgi:hypothetical protein